MTAGYEIQWADGMCGVMTFVWATDEIVGANDEILGHKGVKSTVILCPLFLFV